MKQAPNVQEKKSKVLLDPQFFRQTGALFVKFIPYPRAKEDLISAYRQTTAQHNVR